ncbi:hypothetical protein [Paenibacillus sp. NPDC058174]|uniref:hypothetical protein n=1 Tax=Paenibacillus sp. NPDC058174 TaxID=3346366 RepID=UPI0036DEEDF6
MSNVETHYTEIRENKFSIYFAISQLLKNSLYDSSYIPSDTFLDAITLTSLGEKYLKELSNGKGFSPVEIKIALMLKLVTDSGVLIDVEKIDYKLLISIISEEIQKGIVRYPWIYERTLYDIFFEKFTIEPSRLNVPETKELLKYTPMGVFQVKDCIIGPFGVIMSKCKRFLPPVLKAPLWHCSNPSCLKVHYVNFTSDITNIQKAYYRIYTSRNHNDKFLEIEKYVATEHLGQYDWFDDMQLAELPMLLVNAFSVVELQILLANLINKNKSIREVLSAINVNKGTGQQISEGFQLNQILQLLMYFSNEEIVEELERLISDSQIVIPATEIREPRFTYYTRRNAYNVYNQCSFLGVRAYSPHNSKLATIRLRNLIFYLYQDEDELNWKIRHIQGDSIKDRVDKYVINYNPIEIIKNLILASPSYIKKTVEFLKFGHFDLDPEKENQLIHKILWKIGFDINIPPKVSSFFWSRLSNFIEVSKINAKQTEVENERVRSSAVNFFVSLEQTLDLSLTFITWVLMSDHYGDTKFLFNSVDARKTMANLLNGHQEKISYDPDGKNTLYPLTSGFRILSEICSEVLNNINDFKRESNRLPDYYKKSNINVFPFEHTRLIADLDKHDLSLILEFLIEITSDFDRYKVCNVRNRLEHRRSDFPTIDEIQYACNGIEKIVKKMEHYGIIPTVYSVYQKNSDSFGREVFKYRSHDDNEISLNFQTQLSRELPFSNSSLIIMTQLHLHNSNEMLRFLLKEPSEYEYIWSNYPKKRIRNIEGSFDIEPIIHSMEEAAVGTE